MLIMGIGPFCYHWLQNESSGKKEIQRVNSSRICVTLEHTTYTLNVDVRDKRVLICFDGGIPFGSLPTNKAEIIHSHENPFLYCDKGRVYKRRHELEENHVFLVSRDRLFQETTRNFILLHNGRYLFVRYKSDNLHPKYLIVDVKDGVVKFSTTS